MTSTADIPALITALVQAAPARPAEVVDALLALLRAHPHADGQPLARSIARIVELVADDLVDPGVALPALAMACTTLCDARSTARELEFARYEIDTLEPVPDRPRALPASEPLIQLSRGPRPRT